MKDCKHREGCDPTRSERTPVKNKAGEVVDLHDCDYVDERNRLITQAERIVATQTFMTDGARDRAFIMTMDHLALEAGLVSGLPVIRAGAAA